MPACCRRDDPALIPNPGVCGGRGGLRGGDYVYFLRRDLGALREAMRISPRSIIPRISISTRQMGQRHGQRASYAGLDQGEMRAPDIDTRHCHTSKIGSVRYRSYERDKEDRAESVLAAVHHDRDRSSLSLKESNAKRPIRLREIHRSRCGNPRLRTCSRGRRLLSLSVGTSDEHPRCS